MYSPAATSRPGTPQSMSCPPEQSDAGTHRQPRFMQVKVLYTFDDDSKTNCLARCPHPLQIQTAHLDPATEIGIIELRTCVQAIVAASPELVAKLGKDYTVYAYDYSEYETPLVGQGMLSWVLASTSATPTAPAHVSRTMVTGRVSQGGLGLFSTGIRETLEVKLRLVPVPTCLQSEYLASMEKYRDASNLVMDGFDAGAWTAFLRENPGFGANPQGHALPSVPFAQHGTVDAFAISATNTPIYTPNTPADSSQGFFHAGSLNDGSFSGDASERGAAADRRGSFPTTPSQRNQSGPESRPSSRASNRGRPSLRQSLSCAPRVESQSEHESADVEEGPARKRARVEKAAWRGPSAFASASESLRVTASTAASMRGHGPPQAHPSASELAAGEPSNRPPTPRPHSAASRRQPALLRTASSLAYEAMAQKPDACSPPYNSEYAVTSPEGSGSSAASTPMDIPSSPPVLRPISPTPSSPALPRLPDHADSGYVPGSADGYDDDDEMRPLDDDDAQAAASYTQRSSFLPSEMSITEEMPGDPCLLPGMRKILPRPHTMPPSDAPNSSPKLGPQKKTARSKSNQLPNRNGRAVNDTPSASLPIEAESNNQRRRSESFMQEASVGPDSPFPGDGSKPTATKKGSAFSQKRKKAIQQRLASSIAAGEMPPFCGNCGEVSTPTWRKAFVKVEQGSPDESKILQGGEEGIICWETVSKDEDGKITSFRILKKANGSGELGWDDLQLCNPCGIWLYKYKSNRPPEKWVKPPPKDPSAPRRRSSKKKAPESQAAEPASEPAPQPQTSFYENGGTNPEWPSKDGDKDVNTEQSNTAPVQEKRRANSVGASERPSGSTLEKEAAAAALKRAIQSSPPKFPGSKYSPIDLDGDGSPQKTRRLLFPSPRKQGEVKSLEGSNVYESDRSRSRDKDSPPPEIPENNNKENQTPRDDEDDDQFTHLFDAGDNVATPSTPKSGNSSRGAMKTPSVGSKRRGLTPRGFLSSATRRWRDGLETPSKSLAAGPMLAPEQMTPFTAQLTQLISEANNRSPSRRGADHAALEAMFSDQLTGDPNFFGFSDFGPDDLSSDLPLPTSTNGLFALYEDPIISSEGPWSDDQFMDPSIDAFLQDRPGQVQPAAEAAAQPGQGGDGPAEPV